MEELIEDEIKKKSIVRIKNEVHILNSSYMND